MEARKIAAGSSLPDVALLPAGMWTVGVEAREELRQVLEEQKIPQLRAMAAGRRLGVKSVQRDALVAALLENLLDPTAREEAIGGLGQPARSILALAQLLDWERSSLTPTNMHKLLRDGGYSASAIENAMAGLVEKGLFLLVEARNRPDLSYQLPLALGAGLVPLLPEAHAYTGDLPAQTFDPDAAWLFSKLNRLIEVLEHGNYSLAAYEPRSYRGQPTRTVGRWEVVEDGALLPRTHEGPPNGVQVATSRPPIPTDEMARLREASGLGSDHEAIFFLYLLEALGLLRRNNQALGVAPGAAAEFSRKPPDEVVISVTTALMHMSNWSELDRLLAADPAVTLFRNSILYYTEPSHMRADVSRMRQALVSILAWLPVGAWFDVNSVLGVVHRYFPELPTTLAPAAPPRDYPTWWLSRGGGPGGGWVYLDRHSNPDWMRGLGKLMAGMISGPLAWLGLIEVTAINGLPPKGHAQPAGFRLTGLGGAAFSQRPPEVASTMLLTAGAKPDPTRGPALRVRPDGQGLLLSADPRSMLTEDMILLVRFAKPLKIDSETCIYRMTGQTARKGFEAGLTASDIDAALRRLAGDGLPPDASQRVAAWWDAYGRLRFHTGVSLISLSDEFMLTELLTTTNLGNYVLYQFTPRLVAVRNGDVDRLLDELARAGQAPRVVDASRPAEPRPARPT